MSEASRKTLAQEHYETAAAAKAAAAQLFVARKAMEREIAGLERALARCSEGDRLSIATELAAVRANCEALELRRRALAAQVDLLRSRGGAIRRSEEES